VLVDEATAGFANNAAAPVQQVAAEHYARLARDLAAAARGRLAQLTGCTPATAAAEESCARTFIERFGARAFRRPLAPAEVNELLSLYTAHKARTDHPGGVQLVIEALLQAPDFLYRPEFGASADPLTGYEVATRLSYLLWSTMPDEALFAAAGRGEFGTREGVGREVGRMLADARVDQTLASFLHQWLEVEGFDQVQKDQAVYPQFTEDVRSAAGQELDRTFAYTVRETAGSLETLLTSPVSFVSEPLARLYGMNGVRGRMMQRVQLSATQRPGILTRVAFLADHALEDQSSPIERGKLVRERLFCQDLAPPPPSENVMSPPPNDKVTTRERFEQHRVDPACAGCHNLMDPLGMGFESFDGIGRHRTTDAGKTVDDSGHVAGTEDADGPYRGVSELTARLSRSQQVGRCYVRQWFRFALARRESEADACTLAALDAAFEASGGKLQDAIAALATADAFRGATGN
jgi:hypothetical protein